MKMRAIAACTAFLGLAAGMPVLAQYQYEKDSGPAGQAKIEEAAQNLQGACGSEIQKYCSDVAPGEGKLAACLNAHEDEFLVPCKSAWLTAKEQVASRTGSKETAFQQSCFSDLQKYCPDLPYGGGRLIDCVDQHQERLSDSCGKFHASYEQKLAEAVG